MLGSDFSESVVAKSIHQTVFHRFRDLVVNSVRSASVVIVFFDLRENTSANSHHPKELGDIVTRVITEATEDDQNVIRVEGSSNSISFFLVTCHGSTNGSDMSVVPRIVIDKNGSVTHSCDLVSVVPPGHDLSLLWRVLFDPVVGLSEIIDDVSGSIVSSSRKDDRWGTVGFRSKHGRVVNVTCHSGEQENQDHNGSIKWNHHLSLLLFDECWDMSLGFCL